MGNQGKVQRVIRELVATLVKRLAPTKRQLLEMAAANARRGSQHSNRRHTKIVGVGPATGCRQPLTRRRRTRPCISLNQDVVIGLLKH